MKVAFIGSERDYGSEKHDDRNSKWRHVGINLQAFEVI